jgi:exosortase A-associated hydrolase 2
MSTVLSSANETPFFFNRDSQRLFGVLHQPTAEPIQGAFVFCHPFAEEKLWAHRVYVSFARQLATSGYAVLRFDHAGHGDSDGRFDEADVETYLADIASAIATLKERVQAVSQIGLLGLRLGASLAALVAEQSRQIDRLVLWDPIIDGEKYGQELLLSNLATQLATHGKVVADRAMLMAQMKAGETVNIDGYDMSGSMFNQICAFGLGRSKQQFSGACLIAQIDRRPKQPRADLKALKECYANADLVQVVEQPFWKEIKEFYGRAENLYAATLAWLDGGRESSNTCRGDH